MKKFKNSTKSLISNFRPISLFLSIILVFSSLFSLLRINNLNQKVKTGEDNIFSRKVTSSTLNSQTSLLSSLSSQIETLKNFKENPQSNLNSALSKLDDKKTKKLLDDIYKALNGKTLTFDYPDILNSSDFFFHDKNFKIFIIKQIFSYLEKQNIENFYKDEFEFIFILMFDIQENFSKTTKTYGINYKMYKFKEDEDQIKNFLVLNSILVLNSTFNTFNIINHLAEQFKGVDNKINYNAPENDYQINGFNSFLNYLNQEATKAFSERIFQEMRNQAYQEKTIQNMKNFLDQHIILAIKYDKKKIEKKNANQQKILDTEIAMQKDYFQNLIETNKNGHKTDMGLYYYKDASQQRFDKEGNIINYSLVRVMETYVNPLKWSDETINKLNVINFELHWFDWQFTFNHYRHVPLWFMFFVFSWTLVKLAANNLKSPFTGLNLGVSFDYFIFKTIFSFFELLFNPVFKAVAAVNKILEVFTYRTILSFFSTLLSIPIVGEILIGIITYLVSVILSFILIFAAGYLILFNSGGWNKLESGEKETITFKANHVALVSWRIKEVYVDHERIYG